MLLATLLLCFTAMPVLAQKVAEDAVPSSVKSAFARQYAAKSASWWEQRPGGGYEAVVLQPKQQTMRARYTASGEHLHTSVYVGAEQVSTLLKTKLGAANPGFKIEHAIEVTTPRVRQSGGRFFYVWLMRGSESRGIYVSAEGEAIDKASLPADVRDVETL